MNKIKIAVFFMCALLLCAPLAACGSGSVDSNYDVTFNAADLPSDGTGINGWTAARQAAFDAAYPKVKVNHVAEPSTDPFNQVRDIKDIFSVNSKSTPTIMKINSGEFARQLYVEGYCADFKPYFASGLLNGMKPEALGVYEVGDGLAGFPFQIETPQIGFNISILVANYAALLSGGYITASTLDANTWDSGTWGKLMTKQQFDSLAAADRLVLAGVKSLRISSWDDYRAVAKILTSAPAGILGAGMTSKDYSQGFGNWATANAMDSVVQNADGTISIDFTKESMKDVYRFIRGLKDDGSITDLIMNADINTYYGMIWNSKVASFTFYPSWAPWFNASGLRRDNILTRNFPKGADNAGSAYSPVFTEGYVVNSRATDAQKQAAADYLSFMYSADSWQDMLNYAYDNMILMYRFPPYAACDTSKVMSDLPVGNSWAEAIANSMATANVCTINSIGYMLVIRNDLTKVLGYTSESDLTAKLATLESGARSDWLDNFNAMVTG